MSDSDSSDYGPSLPPALAAKKQAAPTGSKAKAAVGPQLPPHLQNRNAADASDDEDDDDVGPAPARAEDANAGVDGVQAFREREERLEKAKEAAANAEPARPKREEWMLVPRTSLLWCTLIHHLNQTCLSEGVRSVGLSVYSHSILLDLMLKVTCQRWIPQN